MFQITAQLNGQPLGSSPYLFSVAPGPAHLPNCAVDGDGASFATAGTPAQFTVTAGDFYGNWLRRCRFPLTRCAAIGCPLTHTLRFHWLPTVTLSAQRRGCVDL